MVGKVRQIFVARHLVQNVQPLIFTARNHIRSDTPAGKSGWKLNFRASKGGFHESPPETGAAKFGIVAALSPHRAKIQLAALFEEFGFFCEPDLQALKPAPHPRPLLEMHGTEIVAISSADVDAAF